jgi:hypothetical protein
MTDSPQITSKPPLWYFVAAGLGLAWSLFGVMQYLASVRATVESLQAQGLSAEQSLVMTSYPAWMTAAFAIGVFGGTIGCILLLLRQKLAGPTLILSLVAYVVLFVGDVTEGVFAAMGMPQVLVLSSVVIIAAALVWLARRAEAQGIL